MVDSDRGITNLHVPSDIIIDASMPPMIRDSGKMWNAAGDLQDTLGGDPRLVVRRCVRRRRRDCQANGAFDPATMGSVPNVGLMAQKAEEYGSHDKTFEIPVDGTVRVVNRAGDVVLSHEVEAGDIWRACQAKDAPCATGCAWRCCGPPHRRATWCSGSTRPGARRADHRQGARVPGRARHSGPHDRDPGARPTRAAYSLERIRRGEDTISVTGNVLRDYLTDLFPIMELGTSAKMLSIVPLMNGGGLFETGAGGSAPSTCSSS